MTYVPCYYVCSKCGDLSRTGHWYVLGNRRVEEGYCISCLTRGNVIIDFQSKKNWNRREKSIRNQ